MLGGETCTQNRVEVAVDELRRGRLVVLVDSRRDRGDLLAAAELTTAATVNEMARHGRGFVAVAMAPRRGITTGISAPDRARTIALVAEGRAGDLVSPGHVFPLTSAEGGLPERYGRVDAAVDAVRLAGRKRFDELWSSNEPRSER